MSSVVLTVVGVFAIALLMGLSIGILSTIFTASAVAVVLENHWPVTVEAGTTKIVDPYADIATGGRTSGSL